MLNEPINVMGLITVSYSAATALVVLGALTGKAKFRRTL